MNRKTCILAAVAGVLSAGSVWAADTELQNQVNELKDQVSQLQQRQAASSKEVAATIESVLRDAEKRSQMMAAGDSGAGYDNGFYIRSGEFLLVPGILFQFRNVTDYRAGTGGGKDDEMENGFEVRRLQPDLAGTAFTKDLTYKFKWSIERDDGSVSLEDAFVKYMFCDAWGFRAGQFKDPSTRESLVSNGRLLAVERSILDQLLGSGYADRIQGMSLVYGGQAKDNPFNAELVLHDGAASINSNYVGHYPSEPETVGALSSPSGHAFDFGVSGRAEYKVMGDWKSYSGFGGKDVKEQLLVLGGGFDWSQGGNGDAIQASIDAQYKNPNGFTLYAAALMLYTTDEMSTVAGESQTDWGGQIQASYLLNPAWEIFARYSFVQLDNDKTFANGETQDLFQEITVGVVYYLGQNGSAGNRAKITMDLNWLPDGAPKKMSGLGYLGDSNGDTELVVRGQFQLDL